MIGPAKITSETLLPTYACVFRNKSIEIDGQHGKEKTEDTHP